MARSDLCFQDHSGLWGDKGLKTARGNEGPLRHSSGGQRAFSKTIGKKEQGLNLVITVLSWPPQHPVQTVTGVPKNEVTGPLEMSDACRKPYKKEEMQHSSQQQPSLKGSLFYKGPEWD